jgi:hypothetical protein
VERREEHGSWTQSRNIVEAESEDHVMSLRKRRIGRRALGVVVAASLLVLGLETTAWAAPAITGFTPASGPSGCVIVVTGTGFTNPEVNAVTINGGGDPAVNPALFEVQSDTEIWVEANGETGFIEVYNALDETSSSAPTAFQDSGSEDGDCAPTISALNPSCGTVGTPVETQGTNLIDSDFSGGTIEFAPYDATTGAGVEATPTGQPDTPTALHVTVPATAETGRVRVTTAVGTFLTTDPFTVVADAAECPSGVVKHPRSITLKLRKHLIAKGMVSSTEDPAVTECFAGVPVKIQRRKSGSWKNVGKTTTNDEGKYKRRIKDKPGKYRALAPAVTLADDTVCAKAKSPRVKHSH